MFIVAIDLQLAAHCAAELGVGQHALDRVFNYRFRTSNYFLLVLLSAQSSRKSGIAVIKLLSGLHAGQFHLRGVDHNYVVAGIEKRCVLRVVLARENMCDPGREASQGLVRGINHVPLARDFPLTGESGRHSNSPKEIKGTGRPSISPNPYEKKQ